MHETMVAQSLLATISDEAAKQNAKPIGAKISCGTLNAVNDEVLYEDGAKIAMKFLNLNSAVPTVQSAAVSSSIYWLTLLCCWRR